MSGGKLRLLCIVIIIPLILSKKDLEVSCVIDTSCILPCSFKASSQIIIHWIRLVDGVYAHSFYKDVDNLAYQGPQFKNRTTLFDSQISKGNASLMLKNVKLQDSGRYKCYTSTVLGHEESVVSVQVNAPVSRVSMSRTDEGFTCSSEGVYPVPDLTWSTTPPSKHLHNLSSADFLLTTEGLYNVRSFLRLPHTYSSVSCSVKTRSNRKETTLMQHSSIQLQSSTGPLSCSIPTPLTRLSWSFNHKNILKWSPDQLNSLSISEEWRPHVMVFELANLTLKDVSSQHEGTYVCEASNGEETLITEIDVEKEKSSGSLVMIVCVVLLAVLALALAALGIFCLTKRRQQQQQQQEKKTKVEDEKASECLTS